MFLFSTENKIISMKYLYLFFVLGSVLTSCTSPEGTTPSQSIDENFKWIVPTEGISGSLNFFPLAVDPQMTPANEINFIDDNFRVAMVKSGSDIRVYPYDFISKFEAVNDMSTFLLVSSLNTEGLMTSTKINISPICYFT